MKFHESTYRLAATCKPNCRLGSLGQSDHQNCYLCDRKRCLCYFSCEGNFRSCHNRHSQIVRNSVGLKNRFVEMFRVYFLLTLTKEQTKQARSPRRSFGIVSKDIFLVDGRFWTNIQILVFVAH